MSEYGWIWFAIFGLVCPIGMATTVFYGASLTVLLSLGLVPVMYGIARVLFWNPYGRCLPWRRFNRGRGLK